MIANVCGPCMVVSLGLGGPGACADMLLTARRQNKTEEMIMERDFRINSTD